MKGKGDMSVANNGEKDNMNESGIEQVGANALFIYKWRSTSILCRKRPMMK